MSKKKTRTIKVTLPFRPLSINKAWQGRRYKTREYDDFITDCLWSLPRRKMIRGNVAVIMDFYLKRAKNCDVDNFIKPLLDIIVKKGYIKDDRYVFFLQAQKHYSQNEKIKINIILL